VLVRDYMSTIIKGPSECSQKEITVLSLLMKKSGEVILNGLEDRIKNAKCIAFFYNKDEIIGTAALKRPNPYYKKRIFKSAGIAHDADKYEFEVGWAYTEPLHRGRGICTTLLREIIEKFEAESFYATSKIGNTGMHKILERLEFKRIGTPYNGRKDLIQLFGR
jgi:predicted GNAT family acetyltransferase